MEIKKLIRKIDFKGYSFSFKPFKNGYIGSIRQSFCNPDCYNSAYILQLDKNFNVLSSYLLNENVNLLPRFQNWSRGIEDSRLLDDKSLLCVSVDTNPHWKTEMAYVEFSNEEQIITKIVRLYVDGENGIVKNEKNWLFLNKTDDTMHLLYSYNPFQIISVDLNTGKGTIIKSYNKNNINLNSHGGYCIYINEINKYLVIVRNFVKNKNNHDEFINSSWLLFDDEYELCGISKPFLFEPDEVNLHGYQMCMSLHLENEILYSAVTINESIVNIYELNINEVLNSIEIV